MENIRFLERTQMEKGYVKVRVKDNLYTSLQTCASSGPGPLVIDPLLCWESIDDILAVASLFLASNPDREIIVLRPGRRDIPLGLQKYIEENYIPESIPSVSEEEEEYGPEPSGKEDSLSQMDWFSCNFSEERTLEKVSFCTTRKEELLEDVPLPSFFIPTDEVFSDTLRTLVDERWTGKENELYDELGLSKTGFWKIMTGKTNPARTTVYAIAIALHLNIEETQDLMRKAGYAINRSKIQDMIISYFIESAVYDRYTIDENLREYGQQPLPGAVD